MASVEQIFAREYPLAHASFTFHNYLQGTSSGLLFTIWTVYTLLTHEAGLNVWLRSLLLLRIVVFFISLPIRKKLFDKFKQIGNSGQGLNALRDQYMRVFQTRFYVYSSFITRIILGFDIICGLLFLTGLHPIFWSITKFNILKQFIARAYLYYQFPWAQINATRIWNMWNNSGYSDFDLDSFSTVHHVTEKSKYEDQECCICMSKYEMGDQVRVFWCKHDFHKDCVDEWMTEHNKCPYCLQDVSQKPKTD